jgi:hypothetical protein
MTGSATVRRQASAGMLAMGVYLALIAAFGMACWLFANAQDVWIDESTQLSGITLTIPDMLRWLAGEDTSRFGVPGDRMPPVSYFIDWVWLRLAGSSELGFRLAHAVLATGGILVLTIAVHSRLGTWATVACLVFLCLSPNVIALAVEIRAYPVLFALSCVQLVLFLRLVDAPGRPRLQDLLAFVFVSALAVYTHFFGLVSSCSFFAALGLANIRYPRAFGIITAALMAVLGSAVGLIPFVFAAAGLSASPEMTGGNVTEYVTYLLRLIASPAHLIWPWAGGLYIIVTALLLAMSALGASKRATTRLARPVDWLWIVLVAGFAAVTVASILFKGFYALKPSYSVWLIPVLAVLVAAGIADFRHSAHWHQQARFAALGMMAGGASIIVIQMLAHAPLFVHGPRRFVLFELQKAQVPAAILYEGGSDWGYSQIPVHFATQGGVPQYVDHGAKGVTRPVIGASETGPQPLQEAAARYSTLLVVQVKARRFGELKACLNGNCPDMPRFDAAERLIAGGAWREQTRRRSFGTYDVEIWKLERVDVF